jgi:hypothetical protein
MEIKKRVETTLKKLYKNEKYLFDMKFCERTIQAKFAYYLQLEFVEFKVNCEFNKVAYGDCQNNTKKINNKRVYLDITINELKENEFKANICAIELKWLPEYCKNFEDLKNIKLKKNIKKDKERLTILTNYENQYKYKKGLMICFKKNEYIIEEFGN